MGQTKVTEMGEDIIVHRVEAENGGTLIQLDTSAGRLFVEVSEIFRALNNYLYTADDERAIKNGAELIDPENYKNPHLLHLKDSSER